jgi:hypothetical protein
MHDIIIFACSDRHQRAFKQMIKMCDGVALYVIDVDTKNKKLLPIDLGSKSFISCINSNDTNCPNSNGGVLTPNKLTFILR